MGIEQFEDTDEGPSQEAKPDLPRNTDSPWDPGRSGEISQSGGAGHPVEPTPDNSPTRERPERADAEAKPAESRTRSEYADQVALRGSSPIEDHSAKRGTDDPNSIADEHRAAMPYGQGHAAEPHPAQEPDHERSDEHRVEERPPTADDSTTSGETHRSPDDPAAEPAQPDSESSSPSDEPEGARDDVETDSGMKTNGETDDDPGHDPADSGETAAVAERDGPPREPPKGIGRDVRLDADPTPAPEPNEESPGEDRLVKEDPDEVTSETDGQTRPLTDREWAEHLTEVRDDLDWARRHNLQTHKLYTIDRDNREWSAQRNRLQGEIVSAMYERAQDVPCGQQAIIAGGLGGAGKTTILTEHANVDLSNYLVVNPDNIKEEMARRGMIPQVSGLSPMEASDLAHEESSYIAKRLAMRAMTEGKNLIWDITMSSEDSTKERINNLRSSGYGYIEGIFVHIPAEISIRRIDARHREGHEKYRAGVGLGGRFVPEEVPRSQEDPEWGSQNRRTFERVKSSLDAWSVYDNSVEGHPPTRIESSPG